jgi:molybdopterin synthase catalytic subunit
MDIEIELTSKPIDLQRSLPGELAGAVGAVAEFRGIVRADEAGRPIGALEYENYSPMAERTIRQICVELAASNDCQFVRITHRVGVVPVGEAAIHVIVAARHRAAAFALLTGFMDRLKQDVPIWKRRALDSAGNPIEAAR